MMVDYSSSEYRNMCWNLLHVIDALKRGEVLSPWMEENIITIRDKIGND